jgi:copper(I)-binding protein
MLTIQRLSFIIVALACATPSVAQTTVKQAWVRGTVAQQKASGAFMQIVSASRGKLVGVASPVAGLVEIHEMSMDGGVMRMRPVTSIELPAGKVIELKPGGYHVMLMDLKTQLKPGATVPLTLTIEIQDGKREVVQVQAQVKALGAPEPSHHMH